MLVPFGARSRLVFSCRWLIRVQTRHTLNAKPHCWGHLGIITIPRTCEELSSSTTKVERSDSHDASLDSLWNPVCELEESWLGLRCQLWPGSSEYLKCLRVATASEDSTWLLPSNSSNRSSGVSDFDSFLFELHLFSIDRSSRLNLLACQCCGAPTGCPAKLLQAIPGPLNPTNGLPGCDDVLLGGLAVRAIRGPALLPLTARRCISGQFLGRQ